MANIDKKEEIRQLKKQLKQALRKIEKLQSENKSLKTNNKVLSTESKKKQRKLILLTSSLVRYFYLPHDGTYGFKGVSEDLTGDAG